MRLLDSKITLNADNATDIKGGIKFIRGVTEKDSKPESPVNNPDEIDIDVDDENDNDAEIEDVLIEKQLLKDASFRRFAKTERSCARIRSKQCELSYDLIVNLRTKKNC